MKAIVLTIACILCALLFIPATQSAASSGVTQKPGSKEQKAIELKGKKAPATRGAEPDPNIKDSKKVNDPNAKMEAPPSKGGTTARGQGGYCEVRLDNRTPWFIDIYVSGYYRGTLSAYGNGVIYALAGATTVYGRADFTDGSYVIWGPNSYDCGSGKYVYFKMLPL